MSSVLLLLEQALHLLCRAPCTRTNYVALLLCSVFVMSPMRAQAIPVFDASSFAQELVTAIEAVDQTLGQIEDYKLQIMQFQQMVRDGVADVVYTWDRLESIHDRIAHLDEEVLQFAEDMVLWAEQLKTREYYRTSPCYGSDLRCYRAEWQNTIDSYRTWQLETTESQRRTLRLMIETLGLERKKLRASNDALQDLQQQATNADGQWEQLQAANLLTAQLGDQLAAMRELMVQHHNLLVVKWMMDLEREEQRAAASEYFNRPMAERTPARRLTVWPR